MEYKSMPERPGLLMIIQSFLFVPITSSTVFPCCAGSSSAIVLSEHHLHEFLAISLDTWAPSAFMMHSWTAVPTPSRCFRPSLYISLPSAHEMCIMWSYDTWQLNKWLVDTLHSPSPQHLVSWFRKSLHIDLAIKHFPFLNLDRSSLASVCLKFLYHRSERCQWVLFPWTLVSHPNLNITPTVSSLPGGHIQVFEILIISFFGHSWPHALHLASYAW